jgi:hypothetical protein
VGVAKVAEPIEDTPRDLSFRATGAAAYLFGLRHQEQPGSGGSVRARFVLIRQNLPEDSEDAVPRLHILPAVVGLALQFPALPALPGLSHRFVVSPGQEIPQPTLAAAQGALCAI